MTSLPSESGTSTAALSEGELALLNQYLDRVYVPHLPSLLRPSGRVPEDQVKNRSRALSALIVAMRCGIRPKDAADSVVDDYDDYGLDAIYFDGGRDTLVLVQSKLKAGAQFQQSEALSFRQGVEKLLDQNLSGFNRHVEARSNEIEQSVEDCGRVELVVAFTGSGISSQARSALADLIADNRDQRIVPLVVVTPIEILQFVRDGHAADVVDLDLILLAHTKLLGTRNSYSGLASLGDLVRAHSNYYPHLYHRNVRLFQGASTLVNSAIRESLTTSPADFQYLNNGITLTCSELLPRGAVAGRRDGAQKFHLRSVSVINGAQTIGSAAMAKSVPEEALVQVTIIQVSDSDTGFGDRITRARNHQTPVRRSSFAALDPEQERLRRDVAALGLHYLPRGESPQSSRPSDRIPLALAARSLALLNDDPRIPVWLKTEPARFEDIDSETYRLIFSPQTSAYQLVNAVSFAKIAYKTIDTAGLQATGQERLIYRHGREAFVWALARRAFGLCSQARILEDASLRNVLSLPSDVLRELLRATTGKALAGRGPLALFKSQTGTIPLLADMLQEFLGLGDDLAVVKLRQQQRPNQPYPKELFAYFSRNAPALGGG
jgi:hypothetical protein